MPISLRTPTGKEFKFEISSNGETIVIISQNGNQHEYAISALRDLYIWLKNDCEGNWITLGTRGEEETPNVNTVEEWARSNTNPVGSFYGLTPGRKGRFASYIPSILEYFGFVQLTHGAKNNQVRAL